MSDISITAANVIAGSDDVSHVTAAATITAGKVVFKDPTSGKRDLADNNSATAAARVPEGIALNGASLNQPLAIQKSGPITIGGTLVPGTVYFLSGTPGGICAAADLTTGMYPTSLGIALSTTVLDLNIQPSNVAL